MEDSFLTVAEIAELLKLNQQTVRNWIDAGDLAAVRVGRRVRVRQSELDRFIAAGETTSQTRNAGAAKTSEGEAAKQRQLVRDAIAETAAALEGDDQQLADSLNSLIKAARGLTKAMEHRSTS